MILRLLNKRYLILLFTVLIVGCKKLDLEPLDRVPEDSFWLVDANVSNALNTVYSRMLNSQRFFYSDGLSDNAYAQLGVNVGTPENIASGSEGLFTPSLARILEDWRFYYEGIYAANIFLENIDKNTTLEPTVKDRMRAEATFIRAFHYFRLINWYGDVPLLTKIFSIDESKSVPRTPKAEVLTFVLDELDAAISALPKKEDYAAADKGRITKGTAKALKARILLYQGDRMEEVVAICEDLINDPATNGNYSLVTSSYADIFSPTNEYNSEVMLDLPYIAAARTHDEMSRFIPISAAGAGENYLAPTQELVDSYIMTNGMAINESSSGYNENNPYVNRDPRLAATVVYDQYVWTNANGSTQTIYIKPGSTPPNASQANEMGGGNKTPTGYYWRKYYDAAVIGNNSALNLILMRWAEVLLMYAEAKNSLGQMDATVWDQTIKPLRERAGFTASSALNYSVGSGRSMTDIIRNERRSEFALEGLRIDDLRRWRTAETLMNGWVHGAKWGPAGTDNGYIRVTQRSFNPAKHYLWPIPAEELQKNTSLSQNPGW